MSHSYQLAGATPSVRAWHASGDLLAALARDEGWELARGSKAFGNDILLALSCREAALVLVTDNERDFARIARYAPFDLRTRGPRRCRSRPRRSSTEFFNAEVVMRLCLLFLLLVLLACGRGTGRTADGADAADLPAFDPSLEINPTALTTTPSGLQLQDVAVGDGAEATAGREVTVHYTGWLPSGTKFDSSRDRNEPFTFALGAGQVIRGWDEGVAGMKVGGRRKLVIPPDLAYGAAGAPPDIPPNATLVFDVELLGVR